MLSKAMEKALNDQINKEVYSEYFYYAMAAYLFSVNLDGFANFFLVQSQEEHDHVMKFFNYINDRGGRVRIKGIDEPKNEYESPQQVFELALKHEQYVSKSINEIMDLAIQEKDHAAKVFLQWFVDEQVEEEASMDRILNRIKLIGGEGHGLLMIDSELAKRVFTPSAAGN
jgi:ferritin